uniref:Uncharacterized protein n=1 Tax=Kwoniella bestiolae CBS 10118 TaxID=1296100 RepID=A0A1B9G6H3_9TREE|nr:hypothetical protein I302_04296 [Kwoniella bestiolae CBS 10118]OCF26610.1 hypothetical protein I302_04296 [Kwoniella bestiolae CBS 10118]
MTVMGGDPTVIPQGQGQGQGETPSYVKDVLPEFTIMQNRANKIAWARWLDEQHSFFNPTEDPEKQEFAIAVADSRDELKDLCSEAELRECLEIWIWILTERN